MSEEPTDTPPPTMADVTRPIVEAIYRDGLPVQWEFWDGSTLGEDTGPGRVIVRSPDALRRMATAPGELGLGRAFVAGDIEVEGALAPVMRTMAIGAGGPPRAEIRARLRPSVVKEFVEQVRALDLIGRPPPPPAEEIRPKGVRHSISRDKQVVSHHYDVGNDFYRIVLGPSMTYSCARFETESSTLEEAQRSKHLLIARKLGLDDPAVRAASVGQRPRLLDVGCGWGSMAIDVAKEFDVDVVGVTISDQQAAAARDRVREAGLQDQIDIRIQDYRQIPDGPFDAISSIGMAEHVGRRQMNTYFGLLYGLLRPGGRMLNHAISSPGGMRVSGRSFLQRYVFPDGELLDIGDTVKSMETAGFEVRDVENLREHYARTLEYWVANLEAEWERAVDLVGPNRARVWRLYMSGSINGFRRASIQLHQTLGVRLREDGTSDVPATRVGWV